MFSLKRLKNIVILLLITCFFLVGCNKTANIESTNKNKIKHEKKYVDENKLEIGIYDNNNGKLNLLDGYSNKFVRGTDIAVFQLFPSKDKEVVCNNKFAEMFYEKISSTSNKVGFNIKYTLNDGTNFSYNVLTPDEAMRHAEYLEIYLYDDYLHRNDSWYSHVEQKDFNDSTLFTSIKLTPGMNINDIKSHITLTVFTYDTEDDFDPKTNEYRGNSKYSIDVSRSN